METDAGARPAERAKMTKHPGGSKVTDSQMRVLRAVASWISEHGYAPSLRELCERVGTTSTSGMVKTLQALERMKMIRREIATARSLVLTQRGVEMVLRRTGLD